MKTIKALSIAFALLLLVGAGLAISGYGGTLFFMAFTAYNKPAGSFDPANAAPSPDYTQMENWAALPSMADPSDLAPQGIEVATQGSLPVDVFFIHPTGFLTSGSWTSSMDPASGTEENTRYMMANQASAFNGCCNIYAPHYREANIFSYFVGDDAERDRVLGFAYEDVKKAFEYYLEHKNQGRPFIIAGHSQGSHHARRLLKEVIDSSDLHQKMVAAYMIGSIIIPISPDWFASMQHIAPCETADDLHCVIAWDTMPTGAPALERPQPSLCTNPLSWRVDEVLATADLNAGAMQPAGLLNGAIGRSPDIAAGQSFNALGTPIKGLTAAQCKDGTLYVDTPEQAGFERDAMGTYHQLDYAFFYMNIHNNARLRANQYLANYGDTE